MAHDRTRDRDKDSGASFDAAEMVSLAVGLKMTNAQEIASRPRGTMKFCEDNLTDAERFDLWPFEIEKFEAELEAKMEVSDEFGFRLKPQFAKLAGGVVKGGLMQSNQALRWVCQEIERWAVKAMNDEFDRVGESDFCQMFSVEKMPDDTFAWWVGPACYFIVRRGEGAWEPWAYKFVHYYKGGTPSEIAIFESFPNHKEAVAALRCSYDIWEYACRAGTTTALNSGKDLTSKFKKCKNLDELGWYTPWISKGRIGPRPVKCFKPNAWGVHDMHGNVPEWCFDEYGPLPSTLEVNPAGPKYGKSHVIRGGDSSSWPACCRSAARGAAVNDEAGFRPIMCRTEHD